MSQGRQPIICDGCGRDITSTGNCVDYRLALVVQRKEPWYRAEGRSGGAVTAMMIYPPIDGTKHFCDVACLQKWVVHDSEESA